MNGGISNGNHKKHVVITGGGCNYGIGYEGMKECDKIIEWNCKKTIGTNRRELSRTAETSKNK